MSQKKESYSENRKEHLIRYATEKNFKMGGTFRGRQYPHILAFENDSDYRIKKENKYKVVKESNIIVDNHDLFCKEKMHIYAHHLNSSQVMCYNFFRPIMNADGTPKNELIELLKQEGISITEKAKCAFEYDGYSDYSEEGTEFDFHIIDKSNNVEVFFEIKYTEMGFGNAENDERHIRKFNNIYSSMLSECTCLKKKRTSPEDYFKSYQLYRNVIRIRNRKIYAIFIFPKGNATVRRQYENFHSEAINDEYQDNVKSLMWEEIATEKASEFYKKYLAE